MALLLFNLPQRVMPFHLSIQVIAMVGPLLVFYYCSRQFQIFISRRLVRLLASGLAGE
jgi:hypothetical protein